jgi:hypothetical protein
MKAQTKEIWYVRGEDTGGRLPTFFDSKLAAEAYAAILFPDEPVTKRYGRIYYRPLLTMLDINGG